MRIHPDHLVALKAVKNTGNFTTAAKSLGLTQPALTKRIQALEVSVENTVVSRGHGKTSLSPFGNRLLHLANQYEKLEAEFFEEIATSKNQGLSGIVHLGASSSHLGPIAIPSLAGLAQKHPRLRFQFVLDSVENLGAMLQNMRLNFILTDRRFTTAKDVHYVDLGSEEYVLIRPSNGKNHDVYIGTVESDPIHDFFMAAQPKSRRFEIKESSFMGSGQLLIDGVANGYGSSIVPLHLVDKKDKRIIIDRRFTTADVPIFLAMLRQPVMSKLEKAVIEAIEKGAVSRLRTRRTEPAS